jgi:hypothetical protein
MVKPARRAIALFNGDAFGEIPWFVDIESAEHRGMIGK